MEDFERDDSSEERRESRYTPMYAPERSGRGTKVCAHCGRIRNLVDGVCRLCDKQKCRHIENLSGMGNISGLT